MPPFFLTLLIGMFVFFLIHIFTYMDEIIGKGVSSWVLIKFFTYAFISFLPLAMPLGILLSSIMTFGSLAENYELVALKSSGLSLFKIIRPIFFFIIFLAGFTFFFNNFILPQITLNSASLLYDIRQAKPTLSVKEGVFYNQLDGYSIKVGNKSKDGNTLYNVSIYDHKDGLGNNVQLYADSGEMRTSVDTNYLQLQLYHGVRYEDVLKDEYYKKNHPLMQLLYGELTVNIDMSDFKMKHTQKELFKNHHEMMNVWQINSEIDTFQLSILKKQIFLYKQFKTYLTPNTLRIISSGKKQRNLKVFYATLNKNDFNNCVENAKNLVRSSCGYIDGVNEEIKVKKYNILNYSLGWHKKINISFACIVLFFVGASLGAIIRKGGMGLPVVVAVIFFLMYYVVSIIYERLVLEEIYNVVFGCWFPLLLFLPLGIFLTYKAANDSALFDIGRYTEPIRNFFQKKLKFDYENPST